MGTKVLAERQGGEDLPAEKLAALLGSAHRQNALFYGSDGRLLKGGLREFMGLDEKGMPVNSSVMVYLPTNYKGHKLEGRIVFAGGQTHNVGVIKYNETHIYPNITDEMIRDFRQTHPGSEKTDDKAVKEEIAFEITCDSAADVVIRPHNGKPVFFIRKSVFGGSRWPEKMDALVKTMKQMGVGDNDIMIMDYSEGTVRHALKTGQMERLFKLPRRLAEREAFIRDSRIALSGDRENPLNSLIAYYGLNGQRQILQGDFENFLTKIAERAPRRRDVVKALEELARLARYRNDAFGINEIAFFGAEPAVFDVTRIEKVAQEIKKKNQNGRINGFDRIKLRILSRKFREAVPEEMREYHPENEKVREELLQKLMGGAVEGLNLPEIRARYLGPGYWTAAPRIVESPIPAGVAPELDSLFVRMVFPPHADPTLRALCTKLGHCFGDLEYIAPYKSLSSASFREKVDPDREVYLFVIKRKSQHAAMIYHMRRINVSTDEEMDDFVDRIYASRAFRVRMPEQEPFVVGPGEQEQDRHDVNALGQKKYFLGRVFYCNGIPVEAFRITDFKNLDDVLQREEMIGRQAALNAIIGRNVFEGDEVFVLSAVPGRINGIRLSNPTGIFQSVDKKIVDDLNDYACHLARVMLKSSVMGNGEKGVELIRDTFIDQFQGAIANVRNNVDMSYDSYKGKFAGKKVEALYKKALERLRDADTNEIGEELRKKSTAIYEMIRPFVPESGGAHVAVALDQLILTHPDMVGDAIAVIRNNDKTFSTLNAQERQDRINILRLDFAAKKVGIRISELHSYITTLRGPKMDEYALASFEEKVGKDFPQLNLKEADARVIEKVFGNETLLRELKAKGYLHP